jgi:hypothetical protein
MSLETSLVSSGKHVTQVPFQQDAAGSASNVRNLGPLVLNFFSIGLCS